jgi:hypothetical protein
MFQCLDAKGTAAPGGIPQPATAAAAGPDSGAWTLGSGAADRAKDSPNARRTRVGHRGCRPTFAMRETIRINRAPVLTLWAAIVAERLGLPRDTALTCGKAVAGMTAYAKGVRLGIYAPPAERPHEPAPPKPAGVTGKLGHVELLGRLVTVGETAAGPRAIAKGEIVKPEAVERYLAGKFGPQLDAARDAMRRLAASFPPRELEARAFQLYEAFRPEVPRDERGWGAKGLLDLAKIDSLAR